MWRAGAGLRRKMWLCSPVEELDVPVIGIATLTESLEREKALCNAVLIPLVFLASAVL
jgi:hypothetical protein